MMRPLVAVGVLTAVACGEAQGRSDSRAHEGDGGQPDADAAPAIDAQPPDAGADAPRDVAVRDVAADTPPRCAPVAPTDAQPAFPEKRLAVGWYHTCGIRDDGTVQCWGGAQPNPILTPPPGEFVRVSAGDDHTCGIRPSGDVECWGRGKVIGNCDSPDYYECGQSLPPPGRFLELAAGDAFTCGLRPDLTIECWGANLRGETEPPCGQFVQMSAARRDACAVSVEGQVECWPSARTWYPPGLVEPNGEPVKQVALGGQCACILYATGEVDCALLHYDQFHTGWIERLWRWTRGGVAAVFCGEEHACTILEDGSVDCETACAASTSCVSQCTILEDGSVDCEGSVHEGAFTEMSCGWHRSCALRTDGTATCWGGQPDYGTEMPPDFPAGP